MSKLTKKKMKEEGISRLSVLVERFNLFPRLVDYLSEDRIYYSYITGSGMIGSVDTIKYDPKYQEILQKFEQKNNCFVYHAIESRMIFNNIPHNFLNLLYVSDNEEDWMVERLEKNYLMAYVHNLLNPKLSEFGDIFLDSFIGVVNEFHVLVRVA